MKQKMLALFEDSRVQIAIALAVAAAVLCVVMAPGDAEAGELVAARADTFVIGGASSFVTFQTKVHANGNGVMAGDLPDAYLFYSGDGVKFWVTRLDGDATEFGFDTPVPANSSLTIPAPPAFRLIDGNGEYRYYHKFYIGCAAVADSVHIIPLDR